MITRTVSTTSGDVVFFNQQTREQETVTITINGALTADEFVKKADVPGIVLYAENVQTKETLYAISLEEFIKHAEIVE